MPSDTALRAVEAYGGEALWRGARSIEAVASVTGWAFRLKGRPFFDRVRILMEVGRPFSRLIPIGRRPGIAGVLGGADVRLEDEAGKVVESRPDARAAFTPGRRTFRWDDLDMAYFANYAFWNYFTLPALLLDERIDWQETAEGELTARFPDSLPTHCRVQQFSFDRQNGRLLRHLYTPDIISRFARAAHVVQDHSDLNGVLVPTSRRVTPFLACRALPGPVLIDITVHDFAVRS